MCACVCVRTRMCMLKPYCNASNSESHLEGFLRGKGFFHFTQEEGAHKAQSDVGDRMWLEGKASGLGCQTEDDSTPDCQVLKPNPRNSADTNIYTTISLATWDGRINMERDSEVKKTKLAKHVHCQQQTNAAASVLCCNF